jgi:hypothetical protein
VASPPLWIYETSSSEQVRWFRLSPGQAGDKRDDIFIYAVWVGERPLCHPASVSSGLGRVTGGVVFSKLSKLLNQEDALSAPCLRGDFCSPQGPRGAQGYCGEASSVTFDVRLPFAITESLF